MLNKRARGDELRIEIEGDLEGGWTVAIDDASSFAESSSSNVAAPSDEVK